MVKIQPQDLKEAVKEQLLKYNKDVAEEIKKAVEDVAKETKEIIDKHITFDDKSGDYRKSLEVKKVYEDDYTKKMVWHAKGKEYRLTHLLEKGHATKNGGRTQEFPHIQYGDEYAKTELPKRVKEIIEKYD